MVGWVLSSALPFTVCHSPSSRFMVPMRGEKGVAAAPEPRFARNLPTVPPLPFRRGEGRGEGSGSFGLSQIHHQPLKLPGSQSRRRPETHRRGQPLQSGARNAKTAPESAICGVLPNRPTPTGSVFWQVPISNPRCAPRRIGRTNLPFAALRLWKSPPPCGSPPPHLSRKRPSCSE